VPAFDLFPLETIETRTNWLNKAVEGDWLCGFGHDTGIAFAGIVRDPKTKFAVR
jgi:hypothetical protein